MDDLRIPIYYIVSRSLPREQAADILRVLSMTPCRCAVISDLGDAEFALGLAPDILRAHTHEDACGIALAVATETHEPVIVVAEADVLEAVYADGRREKMGATC